MALTAKQERERDRLSLKYEPSARDLFDELRERLLASRPVLAIIDEGKPTQRVTYGKPTFRNRIDETGAHV